jgi:two-component system, LuxR family, response regulator FixJ
MTIDQPTVFVVDDKASVRDALAEMLRVFGYTVATYATAESFFQSLDARRTGVVVADIRMPGMAGIELVRYPAGNGLAGDSGLRTRRYADGGSRDQSRR